MAVLSEAARQQIWRGAIRYWSQKREQTLFVKDDVRAAVDNADVWIDTHEGNVGDTTGYNAALPINFQTGATASQKSDLFIFVAAQRRSVDILRTIVGEVD